MSVVTDTLTRGMRATTESLWWTATTSDYCVTLVDCEYDLLLRHPGGLRLQPTSASLWWTATTADYTASARCPDGSTGFGAYCVTLVDQWLSLPWPPTACVALVGWRLSLPWPSTAWPWWTNGSLVVTLYTAWPWWTDGSPCRESLLHDPGGMTMKAITRE